MLLRHNGMECIFQQLGQLYRKAVLQLADCAGSGSRAADVLLGDSESYDHACDVALEVFIIVQDDALGRLLIIPVNPEAFAIACDLNLWK